MRVNGHQRPKIEEYGDLLFAVLQIVEVVGDKELNVGEVDVFVGRNYVLSVRSRTQHRFPRGACPLRARTGIAEHGAGYVFYAITDAVVDRYFPVLDALEVELEEIETSDLRRPEQPRHHRVALFAEAETDDPQARDQPAAGGDRQALWRTGALPVLAPAGIFPRHLRPSRAPQPVDREPAGNGDDRDFGEPVAC